MENWLTWAQRIVIIICRGQIPDGNFSTTQPLAYYLLSPGGKGRGIGEKTKGKTIWAEIRTVYKVKRIKTQ